MSRIDCSKTLNYAVERKRMCDSFSASEKDSYIAHKCGECPLYPIEASCVLVSELTEAHINAVQKWSDEHPQETMVDRFYKLFPNAIKQADGMPTVCTRSLGWIKSCPKNYSDISCKECWNSPYIEVKQK